MAGRLKWMLRSLPPFNGKGSAGKHGHLQLEAVQPAVELRSEAARSHRKPFEHRPEIRQGHPLNLSISISGGKETNQDSPSSGERTGKSPACESPAFSRRVVVLRRVLCDGRRSIPLEKGVREGENPVGACCGYSTRPIRRVGLFGNAALNGW